jgi:hypothetical protein
VTKDKFQKSVDKMVSKAQNNPAFRSKVEEILTADTRHSKVDKLWDSAVNCVVHETRLPPEEAEKCLRNVIEGFDRG